MTTRLERSIHNADDEVKSAREEGRGWWKPHVESLRREQFHSYESGTIIAGLKWEIETDLWKNETHECYQYDSLAAVMDAAKYMAEVAGMLRIRIVTHRGGYQGMKTLAEWRCK